MQILIHDVLSRWTFYEIESSQARCSHVQCNFLRLKLFITCMRAYAFSFCIVDSWPNHKFYL